MKMNERDLTVTLVASDDDSTLRSLEFQRVIGDVFQTLNELGLQPTTRAMMMESADAGGFAYGIFTMVLKDAVPVITTGLAGWFAGRDGRKVCLKVGELEVEASTPAQAKELLELAQKMKTENEPRRIHEK